MEWYIVQETRTGKEIVGKAATKEKAEKKLEKLNKKNLSIVGVPEVQAGLILYKHGIRVRTVTKETKSLWLIDDTTNPMKILDAVSKERMANFFIQGFWDGGVEDYDPEYANNYYCGSTEPEDIPLNLEEENTEIEEPAIDEE